MRSGRVSTTAGAYASSVVLALIAIAVVVSLRVLQPKEH